MPDLFDPSNPEDRSRLGQLMAHARWGSVKDRAAATAPGRAAFEQRFLDEAEGDPVRAASLRKAYYARLAQQSVAARRAKKAAG